MIPLLFAAALAASPAAVQPVAGWTISKLSPLPAFPGLAQHLSPETCAARFPTLTVAHGGMSLKKLGDLPPGLLEHAVLRSVGGCPVREIVSGGQTYYIAGSDPHFERADPVVHRTPLH